MMEFDGALIAIGRQRRRAEVVPRRQRLFEDRRNPMLIYDARKIRKKFRLFPNHIHELYDMIRYDIDPITARSHAIPGMIKLLTTLRFYATGTFNDTIGELSGISESSALRCVDQVTDAILRKRRDFIRWPQTEDEFRQIKSDFYDLAGE